MIALYVQTLLLLATAYFVGAAIACVLRRSLHSGVQPLPAPARPVEPLPGVTQRSGFARRPESATSSAQSPVPAAVPPPVVAPAAPAAPAQDLKQIRLVDAEIEGRLNKLGVNRYEQIAAWMQPDVRRVGEALGLGDRINRENWIEQAQVLAKGGATHYATRAARGEIAKAAPTPDEGEPRGPAAVAALASVSVSPRASTGGAAAVAADVAIAPSAPTLPSVPTLASLPPYTRPEVSGRAAFAMLRRAEPASAPQPAPAPEAKPAVPLRPASPAAPDNLQRISGVDDEVEKSLAAQGVSRYSQIAHWSPADVARMDTLLGVGGRIGRENWIEQAQILSRGGDTAYSREYDRRTRIGTAAQLAPTKPAAATRDNSVEAGRETPRQAPSDLGALRSVRSAAYQSTSAGAEAAQRIGALRQRPGLEDLKRIRGIGVLIEKKLNQLGVVGYEQIANWTAEDIDRVSQSLDFKGRIERENWVEQARILASGGATEFSRRVDRGEVETSRYRP
jgi:predicted flap endonuclease-1-like 5' DNA nuclease